MSMSVNSVISSYTYTYRNSLRPSLDKNDDGAWDRREVDNYARDYSQATGKSIDTGKLFQEYDGDQNGVLTAGEYESAIKADALGMGILARLRAESQQQAETPKAPEDTGKDTPKTSFKTDRYALESFIEANTYSYGSGLRLDHRAVDKNSDGVWNREELEQYAEGYKKVTGQSIDVDSLMKNYADDKGNISWKDQQAVQSKDLLGLGRLAALRSEETVKLAEEWRQARVLVNQAPALSEQGGAKAPGDLADWMDSLSGSQKTALSRSTFLSEQKSFLLGSMAEGSSAMFSFNNLVSQYNAVKMYSSVAGGQNWNQLSGSVMNAFV